MDLLKRLIPPYLRGSRRDKARILTEYCGLTAIKRKTAVKRFNRHIIGPTGRLEKKTGRKPKYNSIHREIIRLCWELSGYVCAENLHPMLGIYLAQLKGNPGLINYVQDDILTAGGIALGSFKRVISQFPKFSKKRYKGNWAIYRQVPVMADFGKFANKEPGYAEVDFVEHNGGCSSGTYAFTSVYADVYLQWIARAAGYGKNPASVRVMDGIASRKTFHRIKHYHPDNDKSILKVLFEKTKNLPGAFQPCELSRSRPYESNDNAHVEQKNGDKVRKHVGYFRYDSERETEVLNEFYDYADFYDNFFIASAKLKSKIYGKNGRVIKRIHDKPQTPYQRFMECPALSVEEKKKVSGLYKNLTMVELKKGMERCVRELFELASVKNGEKAVKIRRQTFLSNSPAKKSFRRHPVLI